MNHFMARLIFCFFAEDTDIFLGEGLFTKTVEQMSARDPRTPTRSSANCSERWTPRSLTVKRLRFPATRTSFPM
jgi:hypothetical protein